MFLYHEKIVELLERILWFQKESLEELRDINRKLPQPLPPVRHFKIKESSMLPVAPGFSPQYTATPQPLGTVLDPKQPVPTWTSSDPTNAPVTADASGLVATVAIPTTAVVGTNFTLSINYINADGTTATGSIALTIVPAPPTDVTGFTISQSL